jgi:hypothetical protein
MIMIDPNQKNGEVENTNDETASAAADDTAAEENNQQSGEQDPDWCLIKTVLLAGDEPASNWKNRQMKISKIKLIQLFLFVAWLIVHIINGNGIQVTLLSMIVVCQFMEYILLPNSLHGPLAKDLPSMFMLLELKHRIRMQWLVKEDYDEAIASVEQLEKHFDIK